MMNYGGGSHQQHAISSGGANSRTEVQRQLKQNWDNREYIEIISNNIKKISDFLNSFDLSCRTKLAVLNEKLNSLERKIEYLEAKVTKGETLN